MDILNEIMPRVSRERKEYEARCVVWGQREAEKAERIRLAEVARARWMMTASFEQRRRYEATMELLGRA